MTSTLVPGLLDTQIMLDCVRGHPPATSFFIRINWNIGARFSRLTATEILARCQSDADRALSLRFIGNSIVLDLTDVIVKRAVDLLTTIGLPTTLTASDAIIAATAIEHSLPLYTLDPTRFTAVPGITTLQPY